MPLNAGADDEQLVVMSPAEHHWTWVEMMEETFQHKHAVPFSPRNEGITCMVGVILMALTLTSLNKKYLILPFIPEQGLNMLFGIASGVIFKAVNAHELISLAFAPEIFSNLFFEFFLPAIIFSSAFSMKRKNFLNNIDGIFAFAVLGTFLSAFLVGIGLFFIVNYDVILLPSMKTLKTEVENKDSHGKHVEMKLSLITALVYGTILSAVDPLAILSILKDINIEPQVYALLFGENVLNEAIAIVLYNGFVFLYDKDTSNGGKFNAPPTHGNVTTINSIFTDNTFCLHDLNVLVLRFCIISSLSMILGIIVGLVSSLTIRFLDIQTSPAKEQALMMVFAYVSYLTAQICNLSPVMSLFLTAIVMSHYTFYNLSKTSKIVCQTSFRSISALAETFVFVYLGVSVVTIGSSKWNFKLLSLLVLLCLVSRVIIIFFLGGLTNSIRTLVHGRSLISMRQLTLISYSGLRGSVCFALALHTHTTIKKDINNDVMLTSTIGVILFTFLVQGSTSPWLARLLKLISFDRYHHTAEDHLVHVLSNPALTSLTMRRGDDVLRSEHSPIKRKWREFDESLMKPWFGGSTKRDGENTRLSSRASSFDERHQSYGSFF